MPNWCSNECSLIGCENDIKEIVDSEFDFQRIVPIPEGGTKHDLWGTKWQPDVEVGDIQPLENGKVTVSMNFLSAWSPPVAIYRALKEKGISVSAKYYDEGSAYCGTFEDGIDNCYDLPSSKNDPWWETECGKEFEHVREDMLTSSEEEDDEDDSEG